MPGFVVSDCGAVEISGNRIDGYAEPIRVEGAGAGRVTINGKRVGSGSFTADGDSIERETLWAKFMREFRANMKD